MTARLLLFAADEEKGFKTMKKRSSLALGIILSTCIAIVWFFVRAQTEQALILETPKRGGVITSPLHIQGRARGEWFFEGSFPVYIFEDSGRELGIGIAQAQAEWMTSDFVPFRADVGFREARTKRGFLVLKRNNPSSVPQKNSEFKIPVAF